MRQSYPAIRIDRKFFSKGLPYATARLYSKSMTNNEAPEVHPLLEFYTMPAEIAAMRNGDVKDYVTPSRTYVVRLHRHPGDVGHVSIMARMVTTIEHPPEPFELAAARAKSQSLYYKMIDRIVFGSEKVGA